MASTTHQHDDKSQGPLGLGDPEDRTLRKVEKDVMIPMKLRDRTKKEKCVEEVAAFNTCCKDNLYTHWYKCKPENAVMRSCMERWYSDTEFVQECTEEYLKERSEYRRTGQGKSKKRYIAN